MSNYRYTLRASESGDVSENVIFNVTVHTASTEIWASLLERERNRQYNMLFGDVESDKESVRKSDQYVYYTYDPERIRKDLVSMSDIMNMYTIEDVKLESYCHGCIWDRPGQHHHMDCPTGCLHDKIYCPLCQ